MIIQIIEKESDYKVKFFILLTVSLLLINVCPGFADNEVIDYNYDDNRQVTNAEYDENDDGTGVDEIDYTYDSSGNRLVKTVALDAPVNNPPSVPAYNTPANNDINVLLNTTLTWSASTDPDTGDIIYFDVYFGPSTNPPLIKSGLQSTSYQVSLEPGRDYYWKIRARDNHNAFSEGVVWHFTSEIVLPTAEFTASPLTGPQNTFVQFTDQSMSYNDSIISREWDFDYDGSTFTVDSTAQYPIHTYSTAGTYSVGLRITDEFGTDNEIKSAYINILADTDGDGINDGGDNCPNNYNPDQANTDGDSMGDICDLDIDGDNVSNANDNCLYVYNLIQTADIDSDGYGDLCDPDMDGDGINNEEDLCPVTYDVNNADADNDGFGDVCTLVHCVTDSNKLAEKLGLVNSTWQDDVIKLVQGTYEVSDTFSFSSSGTYRNLAILGGYTSSSNPCDSRALDPVNTVINGNGKNVFSITDNINSLYPHWIIFEGMTIENGLRALYVLSQTSDVIINNMIIQDNNGGSSPSPGIFANTNDGKILILNNIIKNNTTTNSYAGVTAINTGSGEVIIAGNIIEAMRLPEVQAEVFI